MWRTVAVAGTLAAWAFSTLALVSFRDTDPPTHLVWPANAPVHNWCGPAGSWFAYHAFGLMGWGAWVLWLSLSALLWALLLKAQIGMLWLRGVGVLMVAGAIAGLQALLFPSTGPLAELPGGMIGLNGSEQLALRFGGAGTALWLLLMLIVGGIVAFDRLALAIPGWTARTLMPAAGTVASKSAGAIGGAMGGAGGAFGGWIGTLRERLSARRAPAVRVHDLDDSPESEPSKAKRHRLKKVTPQVESDVLEEVEAELGAGESIGVTGLPVAKLADLEPKPSKRRRKLAAADAGEEEAAGSGNAATAGDEETDAEGDPRRAAGLRPRRASGQDREAANRVWGRQPQGGHRGRPAQRHRAFAPGAQHPHRAQHGAGKTRWASRCPTQKEKVRLKELMSRRTHQDDAADVPGQGRLGEPLVADLTKHAPHAHRRHHRQRQERVHEHHHHGFLYTKRPRRTQAGAGRSQDGRDEPVQGHPAPHVPGRHGNGPAAAILEWAAPRWRSGTSSWEAGCRDIASYNELPGRSSRSASTPDARG
jgi:hypothetical protein